MLNCKICNKELDNLNSLRIHIQKIHKLSSQEVYDMYFLENGERPKCKCGCGETPSFITLQKGYKEWVRGHIARIVNNWGHNPTAIQNSTITRNEQFKTGERVVWNKGLTKEMDERVAEYGRNGSISIRNNPDEIERRRVKMSNQWKSNNITAEYGTSSHNWKGGTSSINTLVRANKRLYTDWIYPKLVRDEFKCVKCGSGDKLEVHHTDETMADILHLLVDKESEYTFDEKRDIMNKVIDYHIENDVKGETLCRVCHTDLHPSYNLQVKNY